MQTAPNPPLQKRRELALARTAGLASERNTVQDHQAHKNRRQRQTKHLCSPVLICPKHLRSCALICICHDVPCISVLFQRGKARARLGGRASIRRERSTIERDAKLYVSTIRRYEDGFCDIVVRFWVTRLRFCQQGAATKFRNLPLLQSTQS
jgi:hypothetical protein